MKRFVVHSLAFSALLLSWGLSASAQTIADLEIQGTHNVSPDKIRRVLRIKPGDPFDARTVTEAIKRLYATREFADVQALTEPRGGDVLLTVVVLEYVKVDDVRFEGNKHVDKEDLEEATSIKKGSFVRPALLRQDFRKIEEIYKEKGYYRIQVEDELRDERDEKTKRVSKVMIYKIEEGEKVSIRHIDFFGNRAVDSDDIRSAMESKEDRWYRGGEFKPNVLEEDLTRVGDLFRQHGFLDAEVIDKELIFSDDGKGLDIFITVDEGQQYKTGKITWKGNEIFRDEQIRPLVTLKEGDIFDDSEFQEIQLNLNSLYWDRGYIYNTISPDKSLRKDVVDVNFEITEGEPAHIREINITGNTKTSENVIRRELVVNPGDVFLRPRLLRSLREVFNLGFFAGPPEVGTKTVDNGDIDITLKVAEKQTGQFRLGAGFSQLNSISGFIGLAETNFRGKGQQVGVDWEFSRTRQNVDLRFTEPWLFGTPTQFSINVFNRVQNQVRQQFYDDRRRGGMVSLGRPFPWFDYTSIFGRYRYEQVELTDFSLAYTGPLRDVDWPQLTSSISFTLLRNSTDSPFHPSTGTRTSLTAEFNGGVLGGDVRFQEYYGTLSWYERLFWKFVFEFRFEAAILDGYGDPSAVPDYERYRLGGNRRLGVRGYDFYEIVPEGNQLFLGGRYMHILSYQVSVPLAPSVWAVAFWDNGNTWNSFRGADPLDLKKGAGVGIRIELPMIGTMGFDYGYGFDKPGGRGWEPHITLGAGF